eukprot:CAMPEP_0183375726 /NCGR_PEP_ID=MMETSP0164_2-20130417/118248_1 /TAXON_ID=221442 /ORGANISM="Coccolithus pelagicus ssp braarudi, Strain PLY182g" /LENGTH=126 /DNA_ID=CAMNT_0025552929 /DNA_START=1006 /DNA_END=1386 /DNA_ORIENTATION=+
MTRPVPRGGIHQLSSSGGIIVASTRITLSLGACCPREMPAEKFGRADISGPKMLRIGCTVGIDHATFDSAAIVSNLSGMSAYSTPSGKLSSVKLATWYSFSPFRGISRLEMARAKCCSTRAVGVTW